MAAHFVRPTALLAFYLFLVAPIASANPSVGFGTVIEGESPLLECGQEAHSSRQTTVGVDDSSVWVAVVVQSPSPIAAEGALFSYGTSFTFDCFAHLLLP